LRVPIHMSRDRGRCWSPKKHLREEKGSRGPRKTPDYAANNERTKTNCNGKDTGPMHRAVRRRIPSSTSRVGLLQSDTARRKVVRARLGRVELMLARRLRTT
jgi:hypothetical protein